MKLEELKNIQGTYVALNVLPESVKLIKDFCSQNGIETSDSQFSNKLHCTILFSRKPHNIQPDPHRVYESTFKDYNVFSSRDGKRVLVILLDCAAIDARHLQLMSEHGATYDFPVYHAHVSLSYDFEGDHVTLPPMNFPILLGEEFVEPLDLD